MSNDSYGILLSAAIIGLWLFCNFNGYTFLRMSVIFVLILAFIFNRWLSRHSI